MVSHDQAYWWIVLSNQPKDLSQNCFFASLVCNTSQTPMRLRNEFGEGASVKKRNFTCSWRSILPYECTLQTLYCVTREDKHEGLVNSSAQTSDHASCENDISRSNERVVRLKPYMPSTTRGLRQANNEYERVLEGYGTSSHSPFPEVIFACHSHHSE